MAPKTPLAAPTITQPSLFPALSPTPHRLRAAPLGAVSNPVQEGFFTTSDHVRLRYLEAGKGQALVFIPGWLLPAEIWKPQLQGLSQDYHVVALDPRSQGGSEITPRGDEPLRQARDIQELLDHLHLSSVVLVGWSHGAFHVLAYMGEFGTDRLYAVVLVDSALAAASSAPSGSVQRVRFLENFKKDRPMATRDFVWSLFKKPLPPDFFRELTESASRTPTDIALALMNNAFPGESWQPSLRIMCQVPLLYVVTPKYLSQSQYLTQVDPLARVEIFENSGHALFVDEPERFNVLIRDFLRHASLYPAGLPRAAPRPRAAGPKAGAASPQPGTGAGPTPVHP